MAKNQCKLHVFLGAGGVGKTTLSASYALSLALDGKKVGLISIDPAKRLQSALGIDHITEAGVLIDLSKHNQTNGELRASVLHIGDSLKRWIEQKGMSPEKQEKLFANPYFSALAEKIASSTDTLAAIRVAEWIEQFPDTEHLVIDTAPGLHAVDFFVKPEKVSSFLDSKLIDWLKWFVGEHKEKQNIFARVIKSGARRILEGLAAVGGRSFLINFGHFIIMLDEVIFTALERLKYSQKWFEDKSTDIILVSTLREDALSIAKEMSLVLSGIRIYPSFIVLNRSFPNALKIDSSFQEWFNDKQKQYSQENNISDSTLSSQELFVNYLSGYLNGKNKLSAKLFDFVNSVVEVPMSASLDVDKEIRLVDLSVLGGILRKKAGLLSL